MHSSIHVTNRYTEVTNGAYLVRVGVPEEGSFDTKQEQYPNIPGHEILRADEAELIDFNISKSAAKDIEKNIPKKPNLPILQHAVLSKNTDSKRDGLAEFVSTDLDVHKPTIARKVDVRYPNVDAVWPKGEKVLELGFDPDYMIKVCQQFKRMEITCVKATFYGPNTAMELKGYNCDTDQDVRALIMPRSTK